MADIFSSLREKADDICQKHAAKESTQQEHQELAKKRAVAAESKLSSSSKQSDRNIMVDGLNSLGEFEKNKYVTSGVCTAEEMYTSILSKSSLKLDDVSLKLPLIFTADDVLRLVAQQTKRKGPDRKTKKELAEEEANKVRVFPPSAVNFELAGDADVDDKWYEYVHQQAMLALAELNVSQQYIRRASTASAPLTSEQYDVHLELNRCLVASSGSAKQEINGFRTVRDRARMATGGEVFFATFIIQLPAGGRGVRGGDIVVHPPENPSVCVVDKQLMQKALPAEFMTPHEFATNPPPGPNDWIDRAIRAAEYIKDSQPELLARAYAAREALLNAPPPVVTTVPMGQAGEMSYVCVLNNASYDIAPLTSGDTVQLVYDVIYTPPTTTTTAAAGTSKKRKVNTESTHPSIDTMLGIWNSDISAQVQAALKESSTGVLALRCTERYASEQLGFGSVCGRQDRALVESFKASAIPYEIHLGYLSRTVTGDLYDDDDGDPEEEARLPGRSHRDGVETSTDGHRMMSSMHSIAYTYTPTAVLTQGPGGYMPMCMDNLSATAAAKLVLYEQIDHMLNPLQGCMVPDNRHPYEDDGSCNAHNRILRNFPKDNMMLFDEGLFPGRIACSTLVMNTGILEYTYAPQYIVSICRQDRTLPTGR